MLDVLDNNLACVATVKSWETEYLGSHATVLHGILSQYVTETSSSLYARVVPHVQSSGTGKSRAHDELAKRVLYIPLNLAGWYAARMLLLSTYSSPFAHVACVLAFPPRDPEVTRWFDPSNHWEQQSTRHRCHAFLHALLYTTLSHLREICDDEAVAQKMETEPAQEILASEFRNRMAKGRTFEAHGAYRKGFYDAVCELAKEVIFLSFLRTEQSF